TQILIAAGNLPTNGVIGTDIVTSTLQLIFNFIELISTLGSLTIEWKFLRKLNMIKLRDILKNNGLTIGLTLKANYLSMSMFTKNQHFLFFIEGSFDAILKFQYYRTRSVDQSNVIFQGDSVRFRCLAVCANQYLFIFQVGYILVTNNPQTL